MSVHAFLPAVRNLGTDWLEILKALGRGLARALAYAACSPNASLFAFDQENPRLRWLQLYSAIEHLTRPVPVPYNILGEPYLRRVVNAEPALLASVLDEFGLITADVENWRALYPSVHHRSPPES